MKASYKALMASLSLLWSVGCGSDSGGGADDGDTSAGGTTTSFKIFPPKIYSGYDDGTHTYKAPVIAVGASGSVTWSIDDPSIATLKPEGKNVMITMKKAGSGIVSATSGGKTQTAPLKVYAYTSAQYEAGAKRYATAADADNPACTQCHGPDLGPERPNHTPTEVDADTDDELANTFVTGKDPEGRPIAEESEFRSLLNGKLHTWKVTTLEKTGLLAYLRALEPNGYPEYDAPTESK